MSVDEPWIYVAPWLREGDVLDERSLVADELTRGAIARHLDLERITNLSAAFELRAWLDGVEVIGKLSGTVTRICGLTLEPYDVVIDEPILLRALRRGSPNLPEPPQAEMVIDMEAADPPEAFGADGVNLGGFLVETLALALDPFPRKPNAVFELPTPSREASPFDILAEHALRKKATD